MLSPLDESIQRHIDEACATSLANLYRTLLTCELIVPIVGEVSRVDSAHSSLPLRCIRLSDGTGCLPVFASVSRLLEWKPEGALYVPLLGLNLFRAARDVPAID